MHKNTIKLLINLMVNLLIFQAPIYSMEPGSLCITIGTKIYTDPETYLKPAVKDLTKMIDVPEEITDLANQLKHYKNNSLQCQNVILYGPTGNGKSKFAEAIAHEAGVDFYDAPASYMINCSQGSGEANIKALFKHLREKGSPSILLIEFVDIITNKAYNSQEIPKARAALKQELDNPDKNIICIFPIIDLKDIPNSIQRRCKKIHVPLPSEQARFELLKYYSRNKKIDVDDDFFRFLAKEIEGLNCRAIGYLVEEASSIEMSRSGDSLISMPINKNDYLIAAGEISERSPRVEIRKALFKYYIDYIKLDANLIEDIDNLTDILAQESEGLTANDIEQAVNFASSSIELKDDISILNAFYGGIYCAQEDKLVSQETKEKIIKYLIKKNNIALEEEAYEDLVYYTKFENFTGKELNEIINKAKYDSRERGSTEISEEDIYLALHTVLKKKAIATEVTHTKCKLITNQEFGYTYYDLNSKDIDIVYRPLAQGEEFLARMTKVNDKIAKINRLDYINKTSPKAKARTILINYFLKKNKHNLTEGAINELIAKLSPL